MEVKVKVRIAALERLRSIIRLTGLGGMIVLMTPAFLVARNIGRPTPPASVTISQKQSLDLRDTLIRAEVEKYLGVPYRRGGATRKGMDCSGFVRKIYQELFGVDLPHQARSQYALKAFEKASPENLRPGDLIFFSTAANKKRINHVGVYLDDGQFAHAARTSGVVVSSLSNPHWKSRFFAAKRLPLKTDPGQKALENYAADLIRDADQEGSITLGFVSGEFSRHRSVIDFSTFWEDRREGIFGPELAYTTSLSDQSWTLQLGAFREFYALDRPEDVLRKSRPDLEAGIPIDTSDIKHRDGIRFAGGLRLSDYLQITPSLTYFSADHYVDPIYRQRFSLGIDLGMGSWYYDWPISMVLNYAELQSPASRLARPGDELETFDMAITYRHRINPNFHLLFTGEYAERYEMVQQETEELFNAKKRDAQGFSIELNIAY